MISTVFRCCLRSFSGTDPILFELKVEMPYAVRVDDLIVLSPKSLGSVPVEYMSFNISTQVVSASIPDCDVHEDSKQETIDDFISAGWSRKY